MNAKAGSTSKVHIKSRQRVRDLAEVYTHEREVDEMLDLVREMFPSADDPGNTDKKFLEPSCGSGNFLEAILRRKLAFVTTSRFGMGGEYEHRILRAAASVYAIDIDTENVMESRDRLRALIARKMDDAMSTRSVSKGFSGALEVILETNILRADALKDADSIRFIDYQAGQAGTFTREWAPLKERDDLFMFLDVERDGHPVHYSELVKHPGPVAATVPRRVTKNSKIA